jgi:hypothetical protein
MKTFIQMLDELRNTNSSNDKKVILQKYKDDTDVAKHLFYALNPYYKFGVSLDRIEQYKQKN